MRAKPGNLEVLDKYFASGKDFELTQEELEKETGGKISQDLNYLKKKSALSKKAKKSGFSVDVIPAEVKPMKICFRKLK